MIERPRRVVLLIDYDNLQICAARDTPGRELQLPPVVQLAQRYGTVIQARAYAEWNLSTERLAVYKAGIEPAFAPVLRTESDRSGKSLADTVMVAEGMDMLWTLSPDVVVLATSDKDLIPLARVAKQRGAFVVVLGSDFTAIPLREMADEHFTYRQLITEPSGRFTTDAGAGRQPAPLPEPSRRRTRERTHERTTGLVSAPAPSSARTGDRPADRPERTERPEPRPEREAVPALATIPSAEAVAPVSGPATVDADAQAGGRRRRRRGSRRRSERLGTPGEGHSSSESSSSEAIGAGIEDASDYGLDDLAATPTTSIGDVAQASGGTVEPSAAIAPNGTVAEPSVVATGRTIEPDAPAPRDRRRRSRRPTSTTGTAAAASGDEATTASGASDVSSAEATAPPSVGEPSESSVGHTDAAAEPDAGPATPRPRVRRMASAARGRSRSAAP